MPESEKPGYIKDEFVVRALEEIERKIVTGETRLVPQEKLRELIERVKRDRDLIKNSMN